MALSLRPTGWVEDVPKDEQAPENIMVMQYLGKRCVFELPDDLKKIGSKEFFVRFIEVGLAQLGIGDINGQ